MLQAFFQYQSASAFICFRIVQDLPLDQAVLIAGVFIVMERTGAANEDPFENRSTDVALTSICNTIERNLREALGESDLPEKLEPVDGYLY